MNLNQDDDLKSLLTGQNISLNLTTCTCLHS